MKGRGLVLVMVLLACTLILAACTGVGMQGSGNIITETRVLADFKEVEISGIGKIYIQQGTETKVTIEAEDNIMPLLQSKIENNKLQLGPKDGTAIMGIKSLTYYLTIKNISKINLSGAIDLEADNLNLDVLKIETSGAGSTKINGKAGTVEVEISGVGSYQGEKFETTNAKVQVSGAGSANVSSTSKLEVEISGAGTVTYSGNPQISKNISGIGELKKR